MESRVLAVIVAVVFVGVLIFTVIVFSKQCDWTGFTQCTYPAQTAVTIRPAKTLWDWLGLLIVPVVVVATGALLTHAQKAREGRLAERKEEGERDLARDQQREDALQNYFDRLTDLLVAGKLQHIKDDPPAGSDGENALRVNLGICSRTLAVLRRLDGDRKGYLVQFLSDLRLIEVEEHVLCLTGADLRKAALSHHSLWRCRLEKADLEDADLSAANLDQAVLTRANLRGAKLIDVSLNRTDLQKANLSGQKLNNLKFKGCFADELILTCATIDNVEFIPWDAPEKPDEKRCSLVAANFDGAILRNVSFSRCNLHSATFRKAHLSNVSFNGSDVTDLDLSESTQDRVNFHDCEGEKTVKR